MRHRLSRLLAIGCVWGGLVAGCGRAPSEEAAAAPALERPPVPALTWAAYVRQVEAAPAIPEARAAPLLAAFERANRAEVESGGEVTAAAAQAAAELAENAWQFAQLYTPEVYVALGRRRGLELRTRLDALLAWCRENGKTPAEALALKPTPLEALVAVGGPFLRFAESAGLVAEGRVVPGHEPFLQAVFLQHWIAPLRGRMPLDAWLSGDERTWYLRWKVELQAAAPLDRRLAAADELAVLPDYPADLNAGVLLLQAGRKSEAAERLRRSRHPKAAEYLKILERVP